MRKQEHDIKIVSEKHESEMEFYLTEITYINTANFFLTLMNTCLLIDLNGSE